MGLSLHLYHLREAVKLVRDDLGGWERVDHTYLGLLKDLGLVS